MKSPLVCLLLLAAVRSFAADGVAAFQAGLQAFQANGPDALLSAWYPAEGETHRIDELREGLKHATQHLGPVIETQVFAPRNLGKHVQRLYGVIYFERRPLWLRAEYYSIGNRAGFIALEYSLNADEILPLTFVAP